MYSAPVGWHPYPSPCAPPPCFVAWVLVPVQCEPVVPCPPKHCGEVVLPRELAVDETTPSKSDMIGGRSDATLSVEYLVDAAAPSPSVDVTLAATGSTATWTATELAAGYHAKEAVLHATPGTKVTLKATGAIARLRWCERICC